MLHVHPPFVLYLFAPIIKQALSAFIKFKHTLRGVKYVKTNYRDYSLT